jgi:hypothetical protein
LRRWWFGYRGYEDFTVDANQTRTAAPLRALGEWLVVGGITVLEERRPWSIEIS